MRDAAAVTLSSDGIVTLSDKVDGVETLTSSRDWGLKVLSEEESLSEWVWPLNGTSSKATRLSSCKTSLSRCRSSAALSAVARAAANVRSNSDGSPPSGSSEVRLLRVDDSRASDIIGDPSCDATVGTSIGRAVPWGACTPLAP